jgi:hypothetical protein
LQGTKKSADRYSSDFLALAGQQTLPFYYDHRNYRITRQAKILESPGVSSGRRATRVKSFLHFPSPAAKLWA